MKQWIIYGAVCSLGLVGGYLLKPTKSEEPKSIPVVGSQCFNLATLASKQKEKRILSLGNAAGFETLSNQLGKNVQLIDVGCDGSDSEKDLVRLSTGVLDSNPDLVLVFSSPSSETNLKTYFSHVRRMAAVSIGTEIPIVFVLRGNLNDRLPEFRREAKRLKLMPGSFYLDTTQMEPQKAVKFVGNAIQRLGLLNAFKEELDENDLFG